MRTNVQLPGRGTQHHEMAGILSVRFAPAGANRTYPGPMGDRKVRITKHQIGLLAALVTTWLDQLGDEIAAHRLAEARRLLVSSSIGELRELLERLAMPVPAD